MIRAERALDLAADHVGDVLLALFALAALAGLIAGAIALVAAL